MFRFSILPTDFLFLFCVSNFFLCQLFSFFMCLSFSFPFSVIICCNLYFIPFSFALFNYPNDLSSLSCSLPPATFHHHSFPFPSTSYSFSPLSILSFQGEGGGPISAFHYLAFNIHSYTSVLFFYILYLFIRFSPLLSLPFFYSTRLFFTSVSIQAYLFFCFPFIPSFRACSLLFILFLFSFHLISLPRCLCLSFHSSLFSFHRVSVSVFHFLLSNFLFIFFPPSLLLIFRLSMFPSFLLSFLLTLSPLHSFLLPGNPADQSA